ncbi:hypothetical protein P7C73_g3585, partial [Tremellales sp. Uapishka_1]
MPRQPYDVRKIVDALKHPRPDLRLLSAHRGLRGNGRPENVAAEAGLEIVELDLHITTDNQVSVYNPFLGTGQSPGGRIRRWHGSIEDVRLKDDHGRVTLQFIKVHEIDMVLFMDFKDERAIPYAYEVIKQAKNARGVPAMGALFGMGAMLTSEWCVWKLQVDLFPTAEALEREAWVQDALANGGLVHIPVWESRMVNDVDPLVSFPSFNAAPYSIGIEVNLMGPNGNLQKLLDIARKEVSGCIGTFMTMGDLFKPDGKIE